MARVVGLCRSVTLVVESRADTLRLRSFRIDVEQWRRENPSPAGAPPASLVNAGTTLQLTGPPSRYLVFLSRGPDGRYQPLSGHIDPTTSVLRLCVDHHAC